MGVLISHLGSTEQNPKENTHTGQVCVIPGLSVAEQRSILYLFRQEAVHDKDQSSLQAVEDGEDVCDNDGVLLKQEGSEHPHQTQDTRLGYSCHCKSSGENTEVGECRAKT